MSIQQLSRIFENKAQMVKDFALAKMAMAKNLLASPSLDQNAAASEEQYAGKLVRAAMRPSEFIGSTGLVKTPEEPSYFGDVCAFQAKFGIFDDHPWREDHTIVPELQSFRIKFLEEELEEYKCAIASGDMEAAADALVDLTYVALGTAATHGFDFPEMWRRVQRANMAKMRVERKDQSKRGSKFDVVKPEGWAPPDHSDLVFKDHLKWWTSLPVGACVNQMWEEAKGHGVSEEQRVLWLYKKYGKSVGTHAQEKV
jgi:predicted HAD superfamily Cof-like phosphohydrolase